jgi:DNA polymerase III epsilon subunit-like protein
MPLESGLKYDAVSMHIDDQTEWVILDTETDGLQYPIHVVEVAAQRMRGNQPIGNPFRVFLNHKIPIPAPATAIHGYTREFLETNGIDPRQGHDQLINYIENRYIVAHYLRYDWNAVLLPEWHRLRIPYNARPGFCSWHLAKRVFPEFQSWRLDYLREQLGISSEGAHSALGDINAVKMALEQSIWPRLRKIGIDGFSDWLKFSFEKPLLKCHCLILGKNFEEEFRKAQTSRQEERARLRAEQKERDRKEKIFQDMHAGLISCPQYALDQGFICHDPEIAFAGRTFLFHGKLAWGTRRHAAQIVEMLGGIVSKCKYVKRGIDFLVLGEDKDLGWRGRECGTKLVDAIWQKTFDEKNNLRLIVESDFLDAALEELEKLGKSLTEFQND